MHINNQCKAAQIKQKKQPSLSTLKKIKSRDSLCIQQKKRNKLDSCEKNKLSSKRHNQQYLTTTKFKDKNINTKNIQEEYYMKQKQYNKFRKQLQYDKNQKRQKKFIIPQLTKKNQKFQYQTHKKNTLSNTNIPKLKFHDSKVVINFDGKMVKIPANHPNLQTHNYTQIQKSQYTGTEKQFTHVPKNKIKSKTKSKSKFKRLKKSNSGYSIGLCLKSPHRQSASNKHLEIIKTGWEGLDQQFKYKNNLFAEETQVSPLRQYREYERNQIFDFQQIYQLIQEDQLICKEIQIPQNIKEHRKQFIQMLSELSGQIRLRRETFYLGINILDRVISKKLNSTNYYLIALVCLTLAIKLEQSRLSVQFIYILRSVTSDKQSHLQSVQSSKSSNQKSLDRQNTKSKKSLKKWKLKIKDQDLNKISKSALTKILKKYNCSKISKFQFVDLEEKITTELNFKLWRVQAIYWVDLLTCMWDQTIMNEELYKDIHSTSLLFRYPPSLSNLSYLYQILEMSYTSDSIYRFPSIYVVLSIMYLLIRISKQNIHNGFQFYRKSLATSTNILFLDTTGVNQLFSIFIERLQVQMLEILSCCQFISKFFKVQIMKGSIIHQESKEIVDTDLCIHHFNPDIYKDTIQ